MSVFENKFPYQVRTTADDHWYAALRKIVNKKLLISIPQALRLVDHQGTGLFRRKDDAETRACAALALGKIGTSAARDALRSARKSKEPLVRNAISRALKEIG